MLIGPKWGGLPQKNRKSIREEIGSLSTLISKKIESEAYVP